LDLRETQLLCTRCRERLTTEEFGKRLGRDPSMMSRLYRACEEKRN
jgi:hypothetical protein